MGSKVLILDEYAGRYAGELKARFPALETMAAATRAELPADLSGIDVLVAFGIAIDNEMIGGMKDLKWIQSLATGVDHFLKCANLRRETLLTSTRGIHGPAMREAVAFLMLALTHRSRHLARSQDARIWDRTQRRPLLAGKSAAIVGVGVSSSAVAQLLKAFGMHVTGFSRTPRPVEGFDDIIETARLAQNVGKADFLVNVLPGDASNAGIISAEVFAAMKPSACFINIGRGETVDEAALIEALRENRIAGAGLDVFRTHPLPAGNPVWALENVVICPHLAGFFDEYETYALPILIENMDLFLQGKQEEMRNIVAH